MNLQSVSVEAAPNAIALFNPTILSGVRNEQADAIAYEHGELHHLLRVDPLAV